MARTRAALDRLYRADTAIIGVARTIGLTILRGALGLVFIWFGALKLGDRSPVEDLVADVVPVLSDRAALITVGALEVAIGVGLIMGWAIRLTLGLFFLQMVATFTVLVAFPDRSFQANNPFLLTVEGEFVVKNLVLLSAGFVVAGSIPHSARTEPLRRMLLRRAEPPVPRAEDEQQRERSA